MRLTNFDFALIEAGALIHIEDILKHENGSKDAMKIILRRQNGGWNLARK